MEVTARRRNWARRGVAMKRKTKMRCAPRGMKGKPCGAGSEISAGLSKALIDLDLPRLDISTRGKECVLLLMTDSESHALSWPPVLAWYPEEQLVGVVSNRLLPRGFIPMASCSGLLCGFHRDDIFSDGLQWPLYRWKLRVAVCNPGTGFQHKLPVLNMTYRGSLSPAMAHMHGLIKLVMRGNQEQFSIHVISSLLGAHTIYTWHWSSPQVWKSSTSSGQLTGHLSGELIFRDSILQAYDIRSEGWTAMPIPGAKAWNDFPLPEEFAGHPYVRVDPFRYGSRILVVGQCKREMEADFQGAGIVLLELVQEEEEGGGPHWKPLAWARADQFEEFEELVIPELTCNLPLQGGDLVVMLAVTCSVLHKPVALHLKHHKWWELPTSLCRLNPQAVCIYNP